MHPELQACEAPAAGKTEGQSDGKVPGGPHMNALKHGLYSAAILLPGDDVQEYRQRRLAMFHTYRPQTEDEAELVETLAELRWLRRRYQPVQARFDQQWIEPATDDAGRVCEPLGHQRIHSSIDVTIHRLRVDRAWHKARAALFLLQKQRNQGLVEGAVKLPAHCYMDMRGTVFGPVLAPVIQCTPEPTLEPVAQPGVDREPSRLNETGIRKYEERKEMPELPNPPTVWARPNAVTTRGHQAPLDQF